MRTMLTSRLMLWLCVAVVITTCAAESYPQCQDLDPSQLNCVAPEIDSNTQELVGCMKNNTAPGSCEVVEDVICEGPRTWPSNFSCRYTNGYKFETTLALSVFLGYLGIDRFYLGYPAIGLLKFMTLGGFIVGNWVDIILVATQAVGPADGSHYVIGQNGARYLRVSVDSQTYHIPDD